MRRYGRSDTAVLTVTLGLGIDGPMRRHSRNDAAVLTATLDVDDLEGAQ